MDGLSGAKRQYYRQDVNVRSRPFTQAPSASRRARPPKHILRNGDEYYDNACSERFFHSLKVEAFHGEKFETRAQRRETVFEYIEADHHRQRMHRFMDHQIRKHLNNKN